MNILADENMDRVVVEFLRQQGHDVLWILESAPGIDDSEILRLAGAAASVVTFDRDFGELVYHHGQRACGVILLRLQPASPEELVSSVQRAWPRVAARAVGHFIVVTKDKIRVRPLPPAPT